MWLTVSRAANAKAGEWLSAAKPTGLILRLIMSKSCFLIAAEAKRLVMECGDQMSPHLPESTQLRLDAARKSSKRHSSLPLPFLSEQNPFMPSPPTELYMAPSAHPLETHPHQNIQIHHGPYQLQSSRPAQVPRAQSLQLERDSAADSAGVGLLSGRRLSAEYDRPAPSKSLRSL